MYCEIAGCCNIRAKTAHHIFTRGAFGKKALIPENEIHLCYKHHYEVHYIGRKTFSKKYGLDERFRTAGEALYKNSNTPKDIKNEG